MPPIGRSTGSRLRYVRFSWQLLRTIRLWFTRLLNLIADLLYN
jgi:hypothetical protein